MNKLYILCYHLIRAGVFMIYIKKVRNSGVMLFLILTLVNSATYSSVICDLVNHVSQNEGRFCTKTECFFPGKELIDEDIVIDNQINWSNDKNLVLHTKGDIIFRKNGKNSERKGRIDYFKSRFGAGKQRSEVRDSGFRR
jgi:hypothetical protein